jgi:two-component system, OmpR family, sensor histidine kinase KdpD
MDFRMKSKPGKIKQLIYSVGLIAMVSLGCFWFVQPSAYQTVALVLLLTVSLIAMVFDLEAVITAAVLSALIWNYLFIPPRFTFHISKSEDILMFLMYFVIALLNAVLTIKIRQYDQKIQKKEEKENLLKLYNTLLNSLSHELRTPIAAIIGATDNLQGNSGSLSEQNRSDLISEISVASLRLNRHVENLLNMSRLESGTLRIHPDWCDINELVYVVISQFRETARGHRIETWQPETLPYFRVDFGLMEQVLLNLIHNAVVYSPENTVISIRIDCIDEHLVIRVGDQGPGFPEDQIGRVFDRFYRLSNTKSGGTGLGLSIVKGFVEAHQGSVRLENIPGGGACFILDIPARTSYINHLKNE